MNAALEVLVDELTQRIELIQELTQRIELIQRIARSPAQRSRPGWALGGASPAG